MFSDAEVEFMATRQKVLDDLFLMLNAYEAKHYKLARQYIDVVGHHLDRIIELSNDRK